MMSLQSAALSDCGRVRLANEDRWFACDKLGLYVVADGVGSEPHGALAAEAVTRCLSACVRAESAANDRLKFETRGTLLREAMIQVSDQIRDESSGSVELQGMASTVVAAVIAGNEVAIAHLGDSRAYRCHSGFIEQLTDDHSLVELLIKNGEIRRSDADRHPARGQLTRFVGMPAPALPDTCTTTVSIGDRILLCSDGLSGMLNESELQRILSADLPLDLIVQKLVDGANAAGGADNITAIVVTPIDARS